MTSSSALSKISVAAKLWAFHQFGVSHCVPEKPHPSGWAFACLKSMADKRSVCFKHNVHLQNPITLPLALSSSLWYFSRGRDLPDISSLWLLTPTSVHGRKTPKCSLSWRRASNTDYALTFRSKTYRLYAEKLYNNAGCSNHAFLGEMRFRYPPLRMSVNRPGLSS